MSSENQVEKVFKINLSRGVKDEIVIDLERIEDCIVIDDKNEPIRFGEIYKFKKSIIVFMRHPQCFTAKEYMDDLCRISPELLDEVDVQLVTIGPHTASLLAMFREETNFKHKMYADPEKILYKELGFNKEMTEGTGAGNSKHVKSGWLSGVISSTIRTMSYQDYNSDIKQNGGALICGPGNLLHFSHIDKHMFDAVSINQLLEVVGLPLISFPKDPRVITV